MSFSSRGWPSVVLVFTCIAGLSACATEGQRSVSKTERAQLLLEVANGALTEGDWTGALQSLAEAEANNPDLPEIYHARAIALVGRGMRKEAEASVRHSLELAPKYPDANNTLGKLLIDRGDYAEAEKYLKISADNILYRDSYKAQTNLAIIYYRTGEYTKARERLDSAILVSPQIACAAYYYRGHLNLREGRVQDAIDDYDRGSRKFCSRFADAHLALGIAYERGKLYTKARKKYLDVTQNFSALPAAKQAMDRLRYLP